jgi:PhoD related phosphatase
MTQALVLGPLLGLESDSLYTISFVTRADVKKAAVQCNGSTVAAIRIDDIPSGAFWRAEITIKPQDVPQTLSYQVLLGNEVAQGVLPKTEWQFYVPSQSEKIKMAYASCNGFSDYKLMTSTEEPYRLWSELQKQHQDRPFSLFILGGDQVYADSIWTSVPTLKAWNELGLKEKLKRNATKQMLSQIDSFYSKLYCERWARAELAEPLATIPHIMMWDDHDIFDGWGSYPTDLQGCAVYQAIYQSALKYFKLFQLRSMNNTSLLNPKANPEHYSLGLTFRGYQILGMDNRSQRTIPQIMGTAQWADINAYLDKCQQGDLLVMSGVPVVYRDFSFTEAALDATPWQEELTDDLKDHWRAKEHQGERARLIMRLLDNAKCRQKSSENNKARTVILSGDVHVGCLGVIKDTRNNELVNVHQVVSSGIVHPAPSQLQWMGILTTTNDNMEYLDENRHIQAEMLKTYGAGVYLRTRNFVTLQEGTDSKLWVNWVCENNEKPTYPLV